MEDNALINKKFATFITEKRIALGLDLREFSKLIYGNRLRFSYIQKIEKGKINVNITTMEKILKKLNCEFHIEEL